MTSVTTRPMNTGIIESRQRDEQAGNEQGRDQAPQLAREMPVEAQQAALLAEHRWRVVRRDFRRAQQILEESEHR